MFERTTSGQQNRALFYNVSYTCYVEGGGGNEEQSLDLLFWEQVVGTCRPDLKVKFLPRGGKPILEALAKDIIDQDVKSTLVAMDTDYDRLIGDMIGDPRILYSFGYSWENDVFDRDALIPLIRSLSHRSLLKKSTQDKVLQVINDFSNSAYRVIIADLLALIAKSSVLPRDAPGRIIKAKPGVGTPTFERKELIKLIQKANVATRPRQKATVSVLTPGLRYLVGHCLAHAIAMLVRTVMRDLGIKKGITSEHLNDVAILMFGRFLNSALQAPVSVYHRVQCAAIP